MNKNDYLSTLKRLLIGLPEEDINEILYDYEEHFRIGAGEGKTEEQISAELGDVRNTARMYKTDIPHNTTYESTFSSDNSINYTETPSSTIRSLFVAMGLGLFNLIFVLPLYLTFWGVLLGFWGASAGITLGGAGAFLISLLSPLFPSFIYMSGINLIFAFAISVGLTCLGLLFSIGNLYLSKWFFNLSKRYYTWNIDTIINRRKENVFYN